MIRKLTLSLALLCAGPAWSADWGGTAVYQPHADSVKANTINSGSTDNNYGATPDMHIIQDAGTPRHILIQPVADPRTGGYTQDSTKLHFDNDPGNSTNLAGDDSVALILYGLRKVWNEGTKDNAASATGESDWADAIEGTTAWGTAGATNASDRYGPLDTFWLTPAWWAGSPTDTTEVVFTIIGHDNVDSLFTYGATIIGVGINGAPSDIWVFFSDDFGTAAYRPWFEGWETAAATPALTVGAMTAGALTVGGK